MNCHYWAKGLLQKIKHTSASGSEQTLRLDSGCGLKKIYFDVHLLTLNCDWKSLAIYSLSWKKVPDNQQENFNWVYPVKSSEIDGFSGLITSTSSLEGYAEPQHKLYVVQNNVQSMILLLFVLPTQYSQWNWKRVQIKLWISWYKSTLIKDLSFPLGIVSLYTKQKVPNPTILRWCILRNSRLAVF